MASIIQFIKTGELDFIKVGISKKNIENRLGRPDGLSSSKKTVILKYGALQLAFNRDNVSNEMLLNSIHLYFEEDFVVPNLDFVGWIPKETTSQKELLSETLKYNITLVPDKQHTFNNLQVGHKSDAGVVVIFNVENPNDRLVSIHKTKL